MNSMSKPGKSNLDMDTISRLGKLNVFAIMMDDNGIHLKTCRDETGYYLSTLLIRNFSSIQKAYSDPFQMQKGFKYSVDLSVTDEEVKINVRYQCAHFLECGVTVTTDCGTVIFFKTLNTGTGPSDKHTVNIMGEDFQKLKQLPNGTFVLICRIKRRLEIDKDLSNYKISDNSIKISEYMKALEVDLKKFPDTFSKQKVNLRIGEETEVVNKAILCACSPVFAKMFEAGMREEKENTVTITDIKMPVIKSLVSFLYSGLLPDCDINFLGDLYRAANKYDIWKLQLASAKLITDKITLKNQIRVLKLSSLHNDELLKSVVMALISVNIETVVLTPDWKTLMLDDHELAFKASQFFCF